MIICNLLEHCFSTGESKKHIHIVLRQATPLSSAKPHSICNLRCFQSAFRPLHYYRSSCIPTSNSTLTLVVLIVVLTTGKISTQAFLQLHSQEKPRSTFLPVQRSTKCLILSQSYSVRSTVCKLILESNCQPPASGPHHTAYLHTVISCTLISQANPGVMFPQLV